MSKVFLIAISILLSISSCITGSLWKNDNVDPKIKQQIHKLNNQIIDGIVENNFEKVASVCSDSLLENDKKGLLDFFSQVRPMIKKGQFEILNDFYLKNISDDPLRNAITGISGDHDYVIIYESKNSETFVSVGYFEGDLNQTCLTLIYYKQNKEWKLNNIQVGTLRIMNKDAYDWYLSAKAKYEKGYLIDAANDILLAKQILKPANHLWKYQKEEKINEFSQKLMTEINTKYIFPMAMNSVITKPQIFRIFPQGMNEGYFPMIQYTTSVDMNDSIKLSMECDEIHNNIGKLFSGIDKNKEMIFYRAYETLPSKTIPVKSFGFVKRY